MALKRRRTILLKRIILELILEVISRKLLISKTAFYEPFKNCYIFILFSMCIILRVVQVIKVLNDRFGTEKNKSYG